MKQIITFEKEIPFKTMIGEITSISLEHTLHFQSASAIEGDLIISGTYKMTEASALEEKFQYAIPVDIVLTSDLEEENRRVEIDNFTYDILNEEILNIYVDLLVQGREIIKIEEQEEIKEEPLVEEIEEKEEEIKEAVLVDEIDKNEEIEQLEEQKEVRNSDEEDDSSLQSASELLDQQEMIEKMTMKKEPIMKASEEVVEQEEMKEEAKANIPVMNSIFSAFANTPETYTAYSVYILRENDNIEDILTRYNVTREEINYYNNLDDIRVGSKIIIPTTIKDEA